MKQERFYISTIAPDGAEAARKHGLGLEIAEYCTAWNMDEQFRETDAAVRQKLEGIGGRVLHAPFNELFPCAIDPKARALAAERYRQAMELAVQYGAEKVIIHGGYNPGIYYPVWYVEQSIKFWKAFLKDAPGVPIVLENVLEETPDLLLDIVKGVDHPHLKLCLDVGHVNAYSQIPVMDWLTQCCPYLSHFHIHNNDGSRDSHCALHQGTVPMQELLTAALQLCPNAAFTLEVTEAEPSVNWLEENLWNLS
ncbi:MAG: sugar phosphate isomerase/epimerase family protein [Faecousia sp.]